MKQIILQATPKQYDDLVKFLDRRCTIRTDEIADFQSVRAMLRTARLVDIPNTKEERALTKRLASKPEEAAPTTEKS